MLLNTSHVFGPLFRRFSRILFRPPHRDILSHKVEYLLLSNPKTKSPFFQDHSFTMTQLQIESMRLNQSLIGLESIKVLPQSKPSSSVTITTEELQNRKRFCVFLKILSSYLERTDKATHQQVKQLVRHCTRMNRERDIKYLDLTRALQVRLRALVGERLWSQCHAVADYHLVSRQATVSATDKSSSV